MKKLGFIALILLTSPIYAYGEQAPTLSQGTSEIGIQGSIDFDYIDDYLLNFNGSYGYFIRDNWEVGGELDMSLSDNTEAYQFGAFTEYNFPTSTKWVPYVGAAAQYAYSDIFNQDGDAFNFQVAGGVKYFIHPQVAISAEVNYNIATEDVYVDGDGSAQDNKTQILFGTRFYF